MMRPCCPIGAHHALHDASTQPDWQWRSDRPDSGYAGSHPRRHARLFRETGGEPDLLMVERAQAMAFAGGALVFPGGRIDPGDRTLAKTLAGDHDDMAARVAAIRETIEEVGFPSVCVAIADPCRVVGASRRSSRRRVFGRSAVDRKRRPGLDLAALVPSRALASCPSHMRIFDTRFYLARLPEVARSGRRRYRECPRVLDERAKRAERGRCWVDARIIFPTRRNLERLAQFRDFDHAAAHAEQHPIRTITPWTEERDGALHLCIPDDLGYPVASEVLTSATRG